MQKNLSRREALRWMAMTAAAFLVSCVDQTKTRLQTPTQAPSQTLSKTPSPIPSQTATQPPESSAITPAERSQETNTPAVMNVATVYLTKNMSAEGLMQIYEALGRQATGKVAIKIHSGEPGGHHFLQPDFMFPPGE